MSIEKFRWMAAVIAAHPGRKLVGRTRLQKEMWLLQRCGLPTSYSFSLYFYGPYSEGLQADIALLEHCGLVKEVETEKKDGSSYYSFEASEEAELDEIERFNDTIQKLAKADLVVLELAATYDAFQDLGFNHDEAIKRLRQKKREKCEEGREAAALELLNQLQFAYA